MTRITFRNHARLSEKHVRLVKRKIYKLAKRFPGLSDVDVFFKKEARTYFYMVKLTVEGEDILLEGKHVNAFKLYTLGFNHCLEELIEEEAGVLVF